jgi:O-antigen/teichoic acid export membrane protein
MELKEKVIHGLKWMTISKLVAQVFSWIATFIIIRQLTQEDYGIVAIVSATFEIITILATHGFSSSLVKQQKKSYKLSSQIFTASLFINIIMAIVIALFAGSISEFYASTELFQVIVVVACFIPVNSLLIVPSAYLDIDMNFKARALCDAVAAFINTIVALALALYGAGYWALIIGTLANLLSRAFLYLFVSNAKFGLTTDYSNSKETFAFAYKLQLNSILWFSYNKLDTFLVGRFLGLNKLGVYNIGLEIASIPMVKAASIINQVGFSAFSSLKNDMVKANTYLYKALFTTSLIIFPVFIGMASVSNEVVYLLIGEKWIASGPVMAIFCWAFPFRMLNSIIQNYTNGLNFAGLALKNSFVISVILICAISIGAQYGIIETALAWVGGFVFAFAIVITRTAKIMKVPIKTLFCWLFPFLISVGMFLLLSFIENTYLVNDNLLFNISIKIIIGAVYIMLIYLLLYKNYLLQFIGKNY